MAEGFFRELKHYKLYEISSDLKVSAEEAKRLVDILKKYGIVKAVKASKPEYEDLSNQDIILGDVTDIDSDVVYVFDFVGVAVLGEHVFKCYPKYISSVSEPMKQLKKVLKVIKKYNRKEQLVYLYNGRENNRTFNRLAVSLYLLEDYFHNGIYTNQREVIETNGEGEILWDKTINETYPLLQNNRPYYMEIQTRNILDDETDYIRKLHECILSQCTVELNKKGILELFDIEEVELSSSLIEDFGDTDYIKYRLEHEMRTQFITRKQTLLKTIYAYIASEKVNQGEIAFSLYGTNSFNLVWERVCAENFGSVLKQKIKDLPLKIVPEYEDKRDCKLQSIIDKPVWHQVTPYAAVDEANTLKPDLICIYPVGNENDSGTEDYCFGIYDAKYYQINFEKKGKKWVVTGNPGVGDVTKQYLYQLAYSDFILKQGYKYVQNMFFCPQEEAEPDYGYVEMKMMHNIGDGNLENILVVKLCAEEMYDIYLSGRKIKDISKFIPKIKKKLVQNQNFVKRMASYLQGISKVSQEAEMGMRMSAEYEKFMYPKRIKRELGAKLIYDIICPVAAEAFYRFTPCDEEYGNIVAEGEGNSYERCNWMAEAALRIEQLLKDLPEQELRSAENVEGVLKKCFEEMDAIDVMAERKYLDKLTKRVMELVRNVYL